MKLYRSQSWHSDWLYDFVIPHLTPESSGFEIAANSTLKVLRYENSEAIVLNFVKLLYYFSLMIIIYLLLFVFNILNSTKDFK